MSFSDKSFGEEGFGKSYAWIDFVNSEEYDGFGVRSDHLLDPTWISAFLRRWSLGRITGDQYNPDDLIRLRNLLRTIAESLVAGKQLSNRDLSKANQALRTPVIRCLRRKREGSYLLETAPLRRGWVWIQAEVYISLGEMLAEGQMQRLKICPNPGCRWVFLDQTRGNVRKWCSDLTCGNRDKVRRHRALRA